MGEYSKTFPECESAQDLTPAETSFIGSSEAVGCGHEDGPGRMPKFSNSEFPNTESGEGKSDS